MADDHKTLSRFSFSKFLSLPNALLLYKDTSAQFTNVIGLFFNKYYPKVHLVIFVVYFTFIVQQSQYLQGYPSIALTGIYPIDDGAFYVY